MEHAKVVFGEDMWTWLLPIRPRFSVDPHAFVHSNQTVDVQSPTDPLIRVEGQNLN